MILDGCHFQYGDFNSREYGFIFAHCDTSEYNRLMGEVRSTTMFNRRTMSQNILDDDYDDSAISFDAEIILEDFNDFRMMDRRVIEKALFRSVGYQKLYVDMLDDYLAESYECKDGDIKRMYFNCRFMNPSKIETDDGAVVGYQFTIECDSALAWQETTTQKVEFPDSSSESPKQATIEVDTDTKEYTYPTLTIQMGASGGDLTIINHSDDSSRITQFVGLGSNAKITMRGDINFVSGSYYEKLATQNFVRLMDGKNKFGFTGDVVSVQFEWQNRRFL